MDISAADDENCSGIRTFVADQIPDHRSDLRRRKCGKDLGRCDVLGHSGRSHRRDGIGEDVVLAAFDGERIDQTDEPEFRCAVVRLAEVAVDAARRRRDDDAPVPLLTEVRPRSPGDVEPAEQVHTLHRFPVRDRHLVERAVAQNSGVVDDAVHRAELVDRSLDQGLRPFFVGDVVVVCDRSAAGRADLAHDAVCHSAACTRSVPCATEVVDDHERSFTREQQRVLPSEATTGTGDNDDSIGYSWHSISPSELL